MRQISDIEIFVEVANAASFRKAAAKLRIPISTLSRRIAALESAVGLPLFIRTPRLVELTEAGRLYLSRCNNFVEDIRAALNELTNLAERPAGQLRITAPIEFSQIWLRPIIVKFLSEYPEIEIDLDLTPEKRNLHTEKYDFSIRIGLPKEQDLFVRKVTTKTTGLFASPDYLDKFPEPVLPEDLKKHKCIVFRRAEYNLTNKNTGDSICIPVQGPIRVNNVTMLKTLSINSLGISLVAHELDKPDVESGRLVQVLNAWSGPNINVYSVTNTRILPAKARVFLDYLIKNINEIDI